MTETGWKRLLAVLIGIGLCVVLVGGLASSRFDRDELEPRPKGMAPPPRGYARGQRHRTEPLPSALELLKPVAKAKRVPRSGEWLDAHPEEGQLVSELIAERPDGGWPPGRTLYLVSVGTLSPAQDALLDRTRELLSAWYQTEVKRLPSLDEGIVPGASRRERDFGMQWQTEPILEALLPLRPPDAAGVMAVTAVDLYPDPQWNFVFGEARYGERVGVMSLFRHGELSTEPTLVLSRTVATAAHELGHMMGLQHCVAFECAMNGANSQAESDTLPIEPCPACLAKFEARLGLDPLVRAQAMAAAYGDAGLSSPELTRALDVWRDAGLLGER